jgi:hypothetical protein
MTGVVMCALGVFMLVWSLWHLPRSMQRIRGKVVARRGRAERFDAMLESRSYRLIALGATGTGLASLVAGIFFLVRGE